MQGHCIPIAWHGRKPLRGGLYSGKLCLKGGTALSAAGLAQRYILVNNDVYVLCLYSAKV